MPRGPPRSLVRGGAVHRLQRQLEGAARARRGNVDRDNGADAEGSPRSASASCAGWRSRCRRLAACSRRSRRRGRLVQAARRAARAPGPRGARARRRASRESVAARARGERQQHGDDLARGGLVEVAGGLIGEQQRRRVHQRRARSRRAAAHRRRAGRPRCARARRAPLPRARGGCAPGPRAPRTPFSSSTRRTFSSTSSVGMRLKN